MGEAHLIMFLDEIVVHEDFVDPDAHLREFGVVVDISGGSMPLYPDTWTSGHAIFRLVVGTRNFTPQDTPEIAPKQVQDSALSSR
jgi:hypothetical protein